MKVSLEGLELVVRIPLEEPMPSNTGKTWVVASSHGPKATEVIHPDLQRDIIIILNAYVIP